MNIPVKSSNGIFLIPLESKLIAERKIFLEGEIDQETACSLVKQILYLCKEDAVAPIDLMINSPGGEISAGLLIYDCIQSCKTPIRMFCMGVAYSMGALLFASGNHGRYLFPNSELMLHEPLLGNKIGGNATSIHSISESLLETRDKMNQILSKHTGKPVEEIAEATTFDHFFHAEESVAFGLADEIVGFEKWMEE